jgi:hypothetical protein
MIRSDSVEATRLFSPIAVSLAMTRGNFADLWRFAQGPGASSSGGLGADDTFAAVVHFFCFSSIFLTGANSM